MVMRYVFLGDGLTDASLHGMQCDPVRRADGKCIVSVKMASALVVDADGGKHVVPRRRLRLREKLCEKEGKLIMYNKSFDQDEWDAMMCKAARKGSASDLPSNEVLPTMKRACEKALQNWNIEPQGDEITHFWGPHCGLYTHFAVVSYQSEDGSRSTIRNLILDPDDEGITLAEFLRRVKKGGCDSQKHYQARLEQMKSDISRLDEQIGRLMILRVALAGKLKRLNAEHRGSKT